jgi:hypothetical protein
VTEEEIEEPMSEADLALIAENCGYLSSFAGNYETFPI